MGSARKLRSGMEVKLISSAAHGRRHSLPSVAIILDAIVQC